jgi:hypothetical protein
MAFAGDLFDVARQRPIHSPAALAVSDVSPPKLADPRSAALPCVQKKLPGRLRNEDAMDRWTPELNMSTSASNESLHAIVLAVLKDGRLDFDEFADLIRSLSDDDLVGLTRLLHAVGYSIDSDW